MTDEGLIGEPMDEVEAVASLRQVSVLARAFYEGLKEQGFTDTDALLLERSWLHGMAGGKSA